MQQNPISGLNQKDKRNEVIKTDQNQRPHGRNKTVGSGSAGINRKERVGTGSPVGSAGRGSSGASGSGRSYSVRGRASGGKGLSLKTILIGAVIIIGIIFIMSKTGGLDIGTLSDYDFNTSDINNGEYSYSDDTYSSYRKPDYSVSPLARQKRYIPVGSGQDTVTIMVYMCGTDLESKYGMATKDIQEMLKANISDKVNLIIETGGCKSWKNSSISSSVNQIYKVENHKLKTVEKNFGKAAMTDPDNLTKFIDFCEKNYPADRNMLIFWDHGGGSLSGYGYDEKFPSASSMPLSKINSALKAADCEFDIIGFDACLMATLENALVCSGYADYLVASEESEPGTGWYYTNWLNDLSKNTSVSSVDLAQKIIDDFVASCKSSSPSAKVTLSLIDLAELEGTVPAAFRNFSNSTTELIKNDGYKTVSDARAGVRQFAQSSKINQVDLVDLAQRIDTDEANALADALHGCVKYNQSTISRCSGVSIYFPYESTKNLNSAVASYKAIGIDEEYSECIRSFASLGCAGQVASSASQYPSLPSAGGDILGSLLGSLVSGNQTSSGLPIDLLFGTSSGASAGGMDAGEIASLLESISGRSMPAGYEWVNTELIAENAKEIAHSTVDPSRIKATEKDGRKVLELDDKEWALIQTVELGVQAKDGAGYVDLGLDNTFEWYDDNSILLDFDGTWLTLNGQLCAYYLVSDTQQADGSWSTVGRIPALLNGKLVNLQVVFDKAHPEGTVTGAYPVYSDKENIDVIAKGDIEIVSGDVIELVCDYYEADGKYEASYKLGSKITVSDMGLKLTNLEIEAESFKVFYRLTDIYNNQYWIEIE